MAATNIKQSMSLRQLQIRLQQYRDSDQSLINDPSFEAFFKCVRDFSDKDDAIDVFFPTSSSPALGKPPKRDTFSYKEFIALNPLSEMADQIQAKAGKDIMASQTHVQNLRKQWVHLEGRVKENSKEKNSGITGNSNRSAMFKKMMSNITVKGSNFSSSFEFLSNTILGKDGPKENVSVVDVLKSQEALNLWQRRIEAADKLSFTAKGSLDAYFEVVGFKEFCASENPPVDNLMLENAINELSVTDDLNNFTRSMERRVYALIERFQTEQQKALGVGLVSPAVVSSAAGKPDPGTPKPGPTNTNKPQIPPKPPKPLPNLASSSTLGIGTATKLASTKPGIGTPTKPASTPVPVSTPSAASTAAIPSVSSGAATSLPPSDEYARLDDKGIEAEIKKHIKKWEALLNDVKNHDVESIKSRHTDLQMGHLQYFKDLEAYRGQGYKFSDTNEIISQLTLSNKSFQKWHERLVVEKAKTINRKTIDAEMKSLFDQILIMQDTVKEMNPYAVVFTREELQSRHLDNMQRMFKADGKIDYDRFDEGYGRFQEDRRMYESWLVGGLTEPLDVNNERTGHYLHKEIEKNIKMIDAMISKYNALVDVFDKLETGKGAKEETQKFGNFLSEADPLINILIDQSKELSATRKVAWMRQSSVFVGKFSEGKLKEIEQRLQKATTKLIEAEFAMINAKATANMQNFVQYYKGVNKKLGAGDQGVANQATLKEAYDKIDMQYKTIFGKYNNPLIKRGELGEMNRLSQNLETEIQSFKSLAKKLGYVDPSKASSSLTATVRSTQNLSSSKPTGSPSLTGNQTPKSSSISTRTDPESKADAEEDARQSPPSLTASFGDRMGQLSQQKASLGNTGGAGQAFNTSTYAYRVGIYTKLDELEAQKIVLTSAPLTAKEYSKIAQGSFDELQKKIASADTFYSNIAVVTPSTPENLTVNIPKPEDAAVSDVLTRKYEGGATNIQLSSPPSDRALVIMLEINKALSPLVMKEFGDANDPESSKILVRLLQASLYGGVEIKFTENDQKLLSENPVFKQMQQIPGFNDSPKVFRDYLVKMNQDLKAAGKSPYQFGEPLDIELSKSLSFTGRGGPGSS